MRVGVRLPNSTGGDSGLLRAVVQAAEDLGFDSVWTDTHTAIPVSVSERYALDKLGRPYLSAASPFMDPFIPLALAAGMTRRIRLGNAVIPLMLSHPLMLAKQSATLDIVSDGRFELGIGAGWLADEAALLGLPTDHPSGRLREAVGLLRIAWSAPTAEWHGRFYDIPPVGVLPNPPSGAHLPIWIGGTGPAAQRIAASTGCGLLVSKQTPDTIRERLTRNPGLTIGVTQGLVGSPSDWLTLATDYQAAGLELYVLFSASKADALIQDIQTFAREVLASLG